MVVEVVFAKLSCQVVEERHSVFTKFALTIVLAVAIRVAGYAVINVVGIIGIFRGVLSFRIVWPVSVILVIGFGAFALEPRVVFQFLFYTFAKVVDRQFGQSHQQHLLGCESLGLSLNLEGTLTL